MWCNRRSSWTSTGGVGLKIWLRLPVLLRVRHHPKTSDSANSAIQLIPTRAAGDIFSDSDRFFSLSPDPKMLNLVPSSFSESFQIRESNICSNSSDHESNQIYPCFTYEMTTQTHLTMETFFSTRTIETEYWKHSVRHAEATIGERGSGTFYSVV